MEARYSTPALLALEQHTLTAAVARHDDGVAVADPACVEAALARRPSLSGEQQALVTAVTRDGAGVAVVVGKAGAGKTFALDAARDAWQTAGIPVVGCALAARAAAGLQDGTAIASTTIAALLADLDRPGGAPPAGWVVVVDEAGMVGTRTLARLLDHAASARAKVVLVGDPRQLPEIDTGGLFAGLAARLGAVELTDNRRQHETWERAALDELRDGDPHRGLAAFAAHHRVTLATTADAIRDQLVEDWWAATRTHGHQAGVMIAARRADVEDLNARARHRLTTAGALTGPHLDVEGRGYAVGDRVLCLRNDRRIGVVNGDLATITAIDADAGSVTVWLDRHPDDTSAVVELPGRYLDAGHLTHGYAMTAHKAQGATVEGAWVLGSDATYREWAYVALSRARAGTRLYVVGDDAIRHDLADAITDSRAQRLANDHGDPAPTPTPAPLGAAGPRDVQRARALQRRLALVNQAVDHAHDRLAAAQQRLTETHDRLAEHTSGLRRLTGRRDADRSRSDLALAAGDVESWTRRLQDLTAERAGLLADQDGLPPAALAAAEQADRAQLQLPGRAHGARQHERPSREHDTCDFGIA